MQKSVTGVCGVLCKLLGGEVFELFLDFGNSLAAGGCREGGELVQDALQKAEVPVLGGRAGACFPEACVAFAGVGDGVEGDCLRSEFAVGRCCGDGFDGFTEEVLCEELVECVVDFFFARDFETRGAICFEFFDCCHFSSFIFSYLNIHRNGGAGTRNCKTIAKFPCRAR